MIQPKYSFRIISCFLRISLIRPCTFAPFPALLIFSAFKTQTFCPSLICEFYLNPQCFILGKLFAQLCPTLCDPTDCSPPGSSPLSMGFSREEYWSGLLFRPPGDLPDSGIKPGSPALQADSLPPEPPGKPLFFSSWGCPANGHSALSWVRDTWTCVLCPSELLKGSHPQGLVLSAIPKSPSFCICELVTDESISWPQGAWLLQTPPLSSPGTLPSTHASSSGCISLSQRSPINKFLSLPHEMVTPVFRSYKVDSPLPWVPKAHSTQFILNERMIKAEKKVEP